MLKLRLVERIALHARSVRKAPSAAQLKQTIVALRLEPPLLEQTRMKVT